MGGKFHLKLNIGSRPIGNKYPEGKVKRTLKRELKVPEIVEREPNRTSLAWPDCWRRVSQKWWRSASVSLLFGRLASDDSALLVNVGPEPRKTIRGW